MREFRRVWTVAPAMANAILFRDQIKGQIRGAAGLQEQIRVVFNAVCRSKGTSMLRWRRIASPAILQINTDQLVQKRAATFAGERRRVEKRANVGNVARLPRGLKRCYRSVERLVGECRARHPLYPLSQRHSSTAQHPSLQVFFEFVEYSSD